MKINYENDSYGRERVKNIFATGSEVNLILKKIDEKIEKLKSDALISGICNTFLIKDYLKIKDTIINQVN